MHFSLTLGDFVAIAAIVVIGVGGVRAWLSELVPRQMQMQRQLDTIINHLGLAQAPTSQAASLSPQVEALVAAGRKIEAIKLHRQKTGAGLKQARDAVDFASTDRSDGR